jgi:hypothetical protein
MGGVNYWGTPQTLSDNFSTFNDVWTYDPTTGLPWASAGVGNIQGWGYHMFNAATTGTTADVSQCYIQLNWFPLRSVVGIHIYYNGALYQSAYQPIYEPGVPSYQVARIEAIMALKPGDTLSICCTKSLYGDYIYNASNYTFFDVHRLPADYL